MNKQTLIYLKQILDIKAIDKSFINLFGLITNQTFEPFELKICFHKDKDNEIVSVKDTYPISVTKDNVFCIDKSLFKPKILFPIKFANNDNGILYKNDDSIMIFAYTGIDENIFYKLCTYLDCKANNSIIIIFDFKDMYQALMITKLLYNDATLVDILNYKNLPYKKQLKLVLKFKSKIRFENKGESIMPVENLPIDNSSENNKDILEFKHIICISDTYADDIYYCINKNNEFVSIKNGKIENIAKISHNINEFFYCKINKAIVITTIIDCLKYYIYLYLNGKISVPYSYDNKYTLCGINSRNYFLIMKQNKIRLMHFEKDDKIRIKNLLIPFSNKNCDRLLLSPDGIIHIFTQDKFYILKKERNEYITFEHEICDKSNVKSFYVIDKNIVAIFKNNLEIYVDGKIKNTYHIENEVLHMSISDSFVKLLTIKNNKLNIEGFAI